MTRIAGSNITTKIIRPRLFRIPSSFVMNCPIARDGPFLYKYNTPMLSPVSFARRSTACRALSTCFTIVILFYILFDALDLDCSNFIKVFDATHPTAFETFTNAEPELDVYRKQFVSLNTGLEQPIAGSAESAQRHRPDNIQFSPLHRAQDHGYRLGLARSSLSDKSPYD